MCDILSSDAVVARGRTRCLVRDLNDILLKDVGDKIKQDGRLWSIVILLL